MHASTQNNVNIAPSNAHWAIGLGGEHGSGWSALIDSILKSLRHEHSPLNPPLVEGKVFPGGTSTKVTGGRGMACC